MICLGVYGIATTAKIFGVFHHPSKNKIMGTFSGDSVLSEPVDNKTIEKNNELMNSESLYYPYLLSFISSMYNNWLPLKILDFQIPACNLQ